MGLNENDIKDLGDGLEFGNETVPEAVGACTSTCQKTCQNGQSDCSIYCQGGAQNCSGCQAGCQACESCQTSCESGCLIMIECGSCQTSCQTSCEKGCQTSCEKSCQSSCEKGCQTRCEKNCQHCEGYECTYCESCQTSCESSCQTGAQTNTAPTTPATISVPNEIKGGDTIIIQWGTSTDSNLSGYILQKKTDSGTWSQIYKGSQRSFSDTVAVGTSTVQYRVKAYDSFGAESGYKTSNIITIVNNSAPVISGKDTDLGGKKAPFGINVSVNDKESDSIDLVAKLNGSTIKTITNAKLNTNYLINISEEYFNNLTLNARNEIEISATDGKATSYRRYYFTRVNSAPVITLPVTNLGTQNSPFSFKYKITDEEKDQVDVRILYGEKVLLNKKNIPLDTEQTYALSKIDFSQIPSGDISLKVEAKDDKGGVSSKLASFKKEINGCGYIYRKDTTEKVSQIIVTLSAKVDEKSTLKVSVCNNARDNSPSWEDITESLDKIYNIKNAVKTANTWAIGVKAEVVRGKDAGDSYIEAIGINFR
ncbi:MAG: hypothetical protein SOZ22_00260 [Ezakiella sp.]|nr:hypothetical protein [Ezakiella sp.]